MKAQKLSRKIKFALFQVLNGHERFSTDSLCLSLAGHANVADRAEQFHQGPEITWHRLPGSGLLVESRQSPNQGAEPQPCVSDFLHSSADINERDAAPRDAKMPADIPIGVGISEEGRLAGGGIQYMLQETDIRPQNELLAADDVAGIDEEQGIVHIVDGMSVVELALEKR